MNVSSEAAFYHSSLNELTQIQVKHCCIVLSECFIREMESAYHSTRSQLHTNSIPSLWNLEHQSNFALPSPVDTKSTFHCGISLGVFAIIKRMFLLQPASALLVNFMAKYSRINSKRLEALSAPSHSADDHYKNHQHTISKPNRIQLCVFPSTCAKQSVSVQSCGISRLLSFQSDVFGETQVRHIICTHPLIKCITRDDSIPYQRRKLWTSSFSLILFFDTHYPERNPCNVQILSTCGCIPNKSIQWINAAAEIVCEEKEEAKCNKTH